jgi:carboxyl-terminal processing protease
MPFSRPLTALSLSALCSLMVACGGGSGEGAPVGPQIDDTPYTAGEYRSSTEWQGRCVRPRVGSNPLTGFRYDDVQGSFATENHWLRSWTNEYYLWYDEVPDVDTGILATADYFQRMKTPVITDSGQPKDRFHFSLPTDEWIGIATSSSGADYGLRYVVEGSGSSRQLRVSFVEPDPAPSVRTANIRRGATLVAVDGIQIATVSTNEEVAAVNAALLPSEVGESHVFEIRDTGQSATRTVTLTAARITTNPVPLVKVLPTASGDVGYLLFNDHVASSEAKLADAVQTLNAAGISDLVLDMRYNGGGLLAIASQLAYMIAGPANTAGKVFEYTVFNDKYPDTNPFTGQPLEPFLFTSTGQGFSLPEGDPLPSLNLSRLFVLVSEDTCSASESLINGLRGINIPVILIGGTTCGKPYGFVPRDNCGTTYFSVQLRGENEVRFGEYGEGFSPANDLSANGVKVEGCAAADGLNSALGSASEKMLSTALAYRETGVCPAAAGTQARTALKTPMEHRLAVLPDYRRSKWLSR